MRIALTGVSHWHLGIYQRNLAAIPGVELAGVSDTDPAVAAKVGADLGCRGFADHREMLEAVRPDAVFALGYHTDMAAVAHDLLDRRIPFVMEKPCGATAAEVEAVAAHASQSGSFAGVCFSMRAGPLLPLVRQVAEGEKVLYLSLKFTGGLLARYPAMNSDWVIQRDRSRGGAFLNLGVHCLDLAGQLLPQPPRITGAVMSNALGGRDVEDHALVMLAAGDSRAHIETGYSYPAGRSSFDLHFSIRTERHYFVVETDRSIEYAGEDGKWTRVEGPTSNGTCYPAFVAETLRRIQAGEPPLAGTDDMARAMALIEAAYQAAPLPGYPG